MSPLEEDRGPTFADLGVTRKALQAALLLLGPQWEQLLEACSSPPLRGASPRIGERRILAPSRRPGARTRGNRPAATARRRTFWSRRPAWPTAEFPAGVARPGGARVRGPGRGAGGRAAAPGGPAASVTSRGGASASGPGSEPRAGSAARSRSPRNARRGPMERYKALEQLLTELEDFLKILDQENLSSTAVVKKSCLAELLRLYTKSSSSDEEYIYMNKVTVNKPQNADSQDKVPQEQSLLTNGEPGQHSSAPQKSLPDLPPPKIIPDRKQLPVPKIESPEGYYEEAEPYDTSLNEDGEAVSSSYESYDEEESSKGKSAPYQWPSPEASIELMRDARICAFLWRKKWLGQWAKQLCVIKDTRLLCYKSSKDHSPQLDVNLLGSSVVHKEKQVRKKEHKLKITPMNADVIVLGLQSKDQAEQWLRVIQEVSGLPSEGVSEGSQCVPDTQRLSCQKPNEQETWNAWIKDVSLAGKWLEIAEKYLSASEYGGCIDGHPEVPETKDVKKKCSAGLKLSNLMNLGRKKSTTLEPPERSLETSSYLNVLVNSQWKSRWCAVKDSHLHFYQDRNRSKAAQQPLSLVGCEVVPDPSPDHLYSFRILHNGEELAKLEAKSSEEMGHWLGLLLSESGSKTDPEEFTYDYVDADRVSCIVTAAKNSLLLMQRKFSEPNAYIDGLPRQDRQEELYDDVEMSELTPAVDPAEEDTQGTDDPCPNEPDRVYLDLTPVKSFLHSSGSVQARASSPSLPHLDDLAEAFPVDPGPTPDEPCVKAAETPEEQVQAVPQWSPEPEEPCLRITTVKIQTEQQKISFPQSCPDTVTLTPAAGASPPGKDRLRATSAEIKLGKNRTEAEVKRYTEEKERLEKKKEEIRGHLAQLRKEKRELKEALLKCTDKGALASLEQKLKGIDEECRTEESRRVDLELNIVEVKDNLKKAEAGPVTLGTTVDTTHLESVSPRPKAATPIPVPDCTPVNSATALKNRPLSVMVTGKGTVLQKAKVSCHSWPPSGPPELSPR
ncbi:actin filament-associated protein 1-like 2 isoform X3 [Elephas maximus indicus]|uniref:actin filament-associated protein 1-like 2 isoform X3 n=1 Tax=Elephas maximus indicus TaxID=99487 RepID=UPI002116764E|nr:actin filament-associated protein 1-like 2 isoform X3 [Elephas maximus indicus]